MNSQPQKLLTLLLKPTSHSCSCLQGLLCGIVCCECLLSCAGCLPGLTLWSWVWLLQQQHFLLLFFFTWHPATLNALDLVFVMRVPKCSYAAPVLQGFNGAARDVILQNSASLHSLYQLCLGVVKVSCLYMYIHQC